MLIKIASVSTIFGEPMTVAFIISVYKMPIMLERLLARLDGRPCALHIDAKVDAAPFIRASSGAAAPHILPRHVCHWGGFGHVAASIEGLRWFINTDAAHVVLLTGQCYPLRPIDFFERWLETLQQASVISHTPLPHPRWRSGGLDRIEAYHFRMFGRAWHAGLQRRSLPANLKAYGGSSYWCLSRSAAERVIAYIDDHPEVIAFFKHVWIPDETFFQTILASLGLHCPLVDDDVHYIEWVPHRPSPKLITDPGPALASGKWFARKFADEAPLDEIDLHARDFRSARRPLAASAMHDAHRDVAS